MAYEAWARRLFTSNQPRPALSWADRAVELAETLQNPELALQAGITSAVSRVLLGDDSARGQLHQLREQMLARGATDDTARDLLARATFYLAFAPMIHREYSDVDRYLDEGSGMAEAYDLEYWSSLMSGARVLRLTHAGDWQAAEKLAGAILSTREPAWRARLLALICLGRIEARRGQSQMPQHLEAATRVASHDPALASMLWPARAEAAWLVGDHVQLSQEVAAMRSAVPKDPWFTGELAFWCRLAGHPLDELQLDSAEPYRLAQAEAWSAAAEWWTARGCPYEAALCLAKSDDPHLVRSAIAQLDQLGAVAAAAFARRHLRALGVTSVPRGPRPSTSANPAGLTRREQEVLKFVAEGCANAEIAARLFLSEKTVERHLSGAFGKLQAGSRTEAVAVARRIGALADRPA